MDDIYDRAISLGRGHRLILKQLEAQTLPSNPHKAPGTLGPKRIVR